MATDNFKPKGQAKNFKNDSGGGVVRNSPIIGVVKNNIDSNHSGRIEVYIADFGARDPNDSKNWTTVGYMSPFFGSTLPSGPKGEKDYGSYSQNPSSYGMWFSPPDIGSKVVCIFINGDVNYGYYIGSIMDAELLQMIPAIGTNTKTSSVILNDGESKSYGGATQLPVTNINTNNSKITNTAGFLNAPKPVHSYSASIYFQQGLLRDPVRGPVTSSALRESPSRVGWGVSTPGRPIYQGGFTDETITKQKGTENTDALKVIARRSGHTLVMDDGSVTGKDQFIRLRTALGHQILMSDDGQTLFIIHSNGQSYIELGKEGTIDMYSTNSVNIRTQGDLNLHADNNININAKKDLNIAADNIKINTVSNYDVRVGKNYSGYTMGKYTVKVNGSMSMATAGEGSYAAGQLMYINGEKINLNTGATSNPPAEVPLIPQVAHTDTLGDKTKGYAAAPGLLLSIVSRAPAHAPWASAGQGVDVKVSTSASAALPASPSAATKAASNAASTTPAPNPVSSASLSTVPASGSASKALTPAATSGLVGAAASQAAGTAVEAVNTGTSVITDAAGKVNAAVGTFAMTPQQMEAAVLKPGAAALVTGLVQGGASVESAMTSNLFKGTPGAENLTAFANDLKAQVSAKVVSIQGAQTALTNIGAMTGKESSGSVAGLISAASQVGVGPATDFIKNSVGTAADIVGNANKISAVGDAVSGAITAGSLATDLATKVGGGLNSITAGVEGMVDKLASDAGSLLDKAKGVAGAAFSAITLSYKDFTPGVPQNLASIAEKSAAGASGLGDIADAAKGVTDLTGSATAGGSSLVDSIGSAVAGGASALGNAITGAAGKVGDAIAGTAAAFIGTAASVAGGVSNIASNVVKSATSALGLNGSSAIASGVSSLAGGQNAIGAITNYTSKGSNIVPGVEGIGAMAKTLSTAAQNGLNSKDVVSSTISSLTASGNASDLINKATGVESTLTSALAAGKSKLSDLASAGLPPGLAAKLAANMNALNKSGSDPIMMPAIGEGTVDRTEITASIGAVLGDKKITMPNFSGEISAAVTAQSDAINSVLSQVDSLRKQRDDQYTAYATARDALAAANDNLPEGDPAILAAVATAAVEYDKLTALSTQISDLITSA